MTKSSRTRPTCSLLAMLVAHGVVAGGTATAAQEPIPNRPRVFVICNGDACDSQHLRREVTYVDWVRDRLDADIEVLVTPGQTGAGGERYDVAFTGRGVFAGLEDTLQYLWSPAETEAEARDGLTRVLAAGLLRYVARTPTLQRISINDDQGIEVRDLSSAQDDPWNRWVFRTGFSASLTGEDRSDDVAISGSQSASRITEEQKLALDFAGEYARSRFDTSDTTTVTSVTQTYRLDALFVKSHGEHWGFGGRASAEHSSFRNYDLSFWIAPAVEYNFFPYSESTRRQLRFLYSVGPQLFNYAAETIFLKTSELRFNEALTVSLDMEESWGSAIVALEASHLLDDFGKNRLEGYGFVEVQLLRGLGVFAEAGLARVRDQINIPRGDATEAEVLLRQRELLTDFRYEGRVGLNFTFGSIFSEVVNARFGG